MSKILVTGADGFTGRYLAAELQRAGYEVHGLVHKPIASGKVAGVSALHVADLSDAAGLAAVVHAVQPDKVVHLAAIAFVAHGDIEAIYRTNLIGTRHLLEALAQSKVPLDAVLLASSANVYGNSVGGVLDENTPQLPLNAYGASKRAIEDMLKDFGASDGLSSVIFRYFNVAGADPEGELGEQHFPETHLIPLMLEAVAGKRPGLTVFGTDYPTRDGTCVRDYVHVSDLVDAHVLGLRWLMDKKGSRSFNLGTGAGFTVHEVIDASRAVTNRDVPVVLGARRPGDAVALVSGSARALGELGWEPTRSTLRQMIGDAWAWAGKPPFQR